MEGIDEEDATNITINNVTRNSQYDHIILKIAVSSSCVLSIIGSLLIIIAYFAFRDTRTTARQLLVNLSLADLTTALANFTGLLTDFGRFLGYQEDSHTHTGIAVYCSIQAFFSQFGTNVSILWTIMIAVYMLIAIVFKKQRTADCLLPVYYIVSWGIPLGIMIWFGAVGFLGFEPNATPGWCSIKSEPTYAVYIGYLAFVYLAFLVLPVINTLIVCFLESCGKY